MLGSVDRKKDANYLSRAGPESQAFFPTSSRCRAMTAGFLHLLLKISATRSRWHYSAVRLSRSALPITDTELNVMAALAIIGLSSSPKKGYRMPAATGTPSTL